MRLIHSRFFGLGAAALAFGAAILWAVISWHQGDHLQSRRDLVRRQGEQLRLLLEELDGGSTAQRAYLMTGQVAFQRHTWTHIQATQHALRNLRTLAGPRVGSALDGIEPALERHLAFVDQTLRTESRQAREAALEQVDHPPEGLDPRPLELSLRALLEMKVGEVEALDRQVDSQAKIAKTAELLGLSLGTLFMIWTMVSSAALARAHREAIQAHEAWHEAFFNMANVGLLHADPTTLRFVAANDAICRMLGYSREELLALHVREIGLPEDWADNYATLETVLRAESPSFTREKRYRRKDGSTFWGEVNVSTIRNAEGKVIRTAAVVTDISARKAAEQALQKSEARNRNILECLQEGIWAIDDQGITTFASWRMAELLATTPEEMIGTSHLRYRDADGIRLAATQLELRRQGISDSYKIQLVRKDGVQIPAQFNAAPLLDDEGRFVGSIASVEDLSQLHETQEKHLRGLKALLDFRFALDQAALIAITDAEGIITHVNDATCRISGYSRNELVGRNHRFLKSGSQSNEYYAEMWRTISSGRVWKGEFHNRAKDGRMYWVDSTIIPFMDEAGRPYQYLAVRFDITDRKAAESTLKQVAEERGDLLEAVSLGRIVPFRASSERNTLVLGEAARLVLGVDPDRLRSHDDLEGLLDPEGRSRLTNALVLAAPGAPVIFNAGMHGLDGSKRWTRWILQHDVDGLRGIIQDITEQEELEAQVRQAQKMDSLGTFAGGIAHDFNNLLTAMGGAVELIGLADDLPEPHRRRMELIHRALERGRHLVSQLSTFGRRSAHTWDRVDLNHLMHEVASLTAHALPPGIELKLDLFPGIPSTHLDAGQMHQAVMNLVLNARDAMGPEGQILLRSGIQKVEDSSRLGSHEPGDYLTVEVVDTGPGIPPEVLSRIFEPFFTTKGPGKGTGLGLSVVHGVVERHRGWLEVDSDLGRGTTFRILVPKSAEVTASGIPRDIPGSAPLGILIADVESRDLLASQLKTLGREVVVLSEATLVETPWASLGALFMEGTLDLHLLRRLLAPGGLAHGMPWVALGEDPTRDIVLEGGLRPLAVLPLRPDLRPLLRVMARL